MITPSCGMGSADGLEATRRIHREFPQTKVLALTQYDDREYVFSLV